LNAQPSTHCRITLPVAIICRRIALSTTQLAACEMHQWTHRRHPVRTRVCILVYRLPKAKANAHLSTSAAPPPPSRTLQPATSLPKHTFASKHPDYWISTSFSALHNILSSVFSVIIHSAFRSIASQAQLTFTRAPHHTTDTSLPTQHFAFLGHRRSGSTKKDLGTSVATPRVLGIEQRHRQSNLPYWNNTFSIIINLYNYLWAYFHNFGVPGPRLLTA
jgi:hypothetical protein